MKYIIKHNTGYYTGRCVQFLLEVYAGATVKDEAKRYDTYEEAKCDLDIIKDICVNTSSAQIEEIEE